MLSCCIIIQGKRGPDCTPAEYTRHSHMSQEIAAEMGYRAELGSNIDCYIEYENI